MNKTLADGQTNNIILSISDKEKDIGVAIDNRLSFKDHIAHQTAKANKIVCHILQKSSQTNSRVWTQHRAAIRERTMLRS